MDVALKVGKETLLNINSLEYEWIRGLSKDGNPPEEINKVIQRCLGGSTTVANTMRQVAIKQCSVHELLPLLTQR